MTDSREAIHLSEVDYQRIVFFVGLLNVALRFLTTKPVTLDAGTRMREEDELDAKRAGYRPPEPPPAA